MEKLRQKVYIANVWSADKAHLIYAAISVLTIIFVEFVAKIQRNYFDEYTSFFIYISLQCVAFVVGFIGLYMYKCFKKRSKFNIFFTKKKDVVDWNKLAENYHICQSDDNGVIFVNHKDVDRYESRNLLINYRNTKIAEKRLFGNK